MKKWQKGLVGTLLAMCMVVLGACGQQESTAGTPGAAGGASTASTDDAFYNGLPFKEVLPLDAGEITVNGQQKDIKIGFSQTCFNHPWRVENTNSAKAEVARHANVQLIVTDGNCDVVKQSADISDLISQGVDAIVMSPVESAGLVNAVNKAIAANIPVITIDRDVTTKRTVFIGQSNFSLGARVAEEMVKRLNGKGNVMEITGLQGSSPAVGRHEGFMSVVQKYPDIKVLAQGDGQWIREPAVKLMEDWLQANKEINAVFSAAEESSWGADLAIKRAARDKDGILQFTMDGSNEGFRSVKSGQFAADGNYTPFIGQVGIRAALYKLSGKPFTGTEAGEFGDQITLPDSPVVVKENADEWIGKGWGE